ncbi:zinc transporter foi-like [Zophobas morio]|uniref:zinc transporter foi-like n=1 Tax=Zophobas morio TaxID=2755281 RepID=UPI00308303D9
MAAHVISVCVFCLICATHSPCGSHAAVAHENPQVHNYHNVHNPTIIKREKFKEKDPWDNSVLNISGENTKVHVLNKRQSDDSSDINVNNKNFYLKKLFAKYGDGKTLTIDGFQNLLDHLFELQLLGKHLNHTEASSEPQTNDTCFINKSLVAVSNSSSSNNQTDALNYTTIDTLCPAILYSIVSGSCTHNVLGLGVKEESIRHTSTSVSTWLYSMGAVFVISACGVLSLLIIPVMQKKFYKPLLQFLVALAVGTLAGDALLHLLPHAMSSGHHHDHGHEESHENMWKGFVAMLGLILFFVMERFIPLVHRWRKGKPQKSHSHVKVLSSGLDINKAADTQCKDRYNAYPRCYKDIVDDPNTTFLEAGETSNGLEELLSTRKKKPLKQNALCGRGEMAKSEATTKDKENGETNQNMTECPNDLNSSNNCTEINKMLPHIEVSGHEEPEADYTVILTEHGAVHHGHSHLHGHVHAAPQNFSSVAWMVIMGDGLHNFTDGMAIGAAFSGSVAGGFSTAVAVFCHELPHEVGDFAMLLKAGMSIKQALFYNIISSILCVLGNLLGVWLGNTEVASSWVFAVAAGTFIYIALVDMIPELSSAHEDEGNLIQSILHLSGLLLGFGIMTLIALYEHDLKNMFKD